MKFKLLRLKEHSYTHTPENNLTNILKNFGFKLCVNGLQDDSMCFKIDEIPTDSDLKFYRELVKNLIKKLRMTCIKFQDSFDMDLEKTKKSGFSKLVVKLYN